MFGLQRVLELVGVVLQAITPFEIPLEEIQTIFDTAEDLGLEWRIVNEASQRRVLEYIPESVDPNPALILLFHGFNGNPATLFTAGVPVFAGLLEFADNKHFVLMAPEATGLVGDTTIRSWNDYGRPLLNPDVDDVAFVSEVIDWAVGEHNVDRDRVFAAGVSGGGSMIYRLLQERSDLVAAAAPLISLLPRDELPPPVQYTPTPIITVAGTRDNSFFFNGGAAPFYVSRSFADTVSRMASLNQATSAVPTVSTNTQDLSDISSPFIRQDDCTVDAIQYVPVSSGGAPLEAYVVQGMGHQVPGTSLYTLYRPIHPFIFGPVRCDTGFDFMATMVEFFERYGL